MYDLFVASADLPFFAEAAEKMKEINIPLRKFAEEVYGRGNWESYRSFRVQADKQRKISDGRAIADIYFEERPQDTPYRTGHSYYWIYLEWYRLQLEHPHVEAETPEFLNLFRTSVQIGNVFGLDNPWD